MNKAGGKHRFGKRTHASIKRASREYHASIARAHVSSATTANHSSFQTKRKFVECLSFRRLSQTSTSMFQSIICAMSTRLFSQFNKRLITISASTVYKDQKASTHRKAVWSFQFHSLITRAILRMLVFQKIANQTTTSPNIDKHASFAEFILAYKLLSVFKVP